MSHFVIGSLVELTLFVVFIILLIIKESLFHEIRRRTMLLYWNFKYKYYIRKIENGNKEVKYLARHCMAKREVYKNTKSANYSSDTLIALNDDNGFENSTIKNLLIPLSSLDHNSDDFDKLLKVICCKYNK